MPTSGLVLPSEFSADRVTVAAAANGWLYCAFVDTSAAPPRAMLVRQALADPQYLFDNRWAIVGPVPVPGLTDGIHFSTPNVRGARAACVLMLGGSPAAAQQGPAALGRVGLRWASCAASRRAAQCPLASQFVAP